MIVRMWHGRVPTARAEEYRQFLNERAVPDYRAVPGNLSVHILERTDGAVTHFVTMTLWDSLEAIRAFAGADIEAAKYYPEDRAFLLEFEPRVAHYEVVGHAVAPAGSHNGLNGRTFHLRDAREADVPALAALHVKTFNETHRGGRPGGPSYELRERQWRDAFERQDGSWFCCVIEDERDELVGFAKGTLHDGGVPGYAGELNKIYVLQRVQRQGLGRVLLCAAARRFLERGVTSMLLFGDAESPSNGFYEAFGAERLYSDRGEFHGGYGWPDLRKLIARCGS